MFCKGQSILFAQDLNEVTDKLPVMLPRSSDSIGMAVISERRENQKSEKIYEISRVRVYKALNRLIKCNPLYSDVKIDENVDLSQEHVIRVVDDEDEVQKTVEFHFIDISKTGRILRGDFHQGTFDESLEICIKTERKGVSSCANAITNFARSTIMDPSEWSRNILNENLISGNLLHLTVEARKKSMKKDEYKDEKEPLKFEDFKIIQNDFKLDFSDDVALQFSLIFDETKFLFGNLRKNPKKNTKEMEFKNALIENFKTHSFGLIEASSQYVGVMRMKEKYYFSDSYACGPKGMRAGKSGAACIIQCDTIDELFRVTKRCLKGSFKIYSIDIFSKIVEKKEDEILEPYVKIQSQISNQKKCENEVKKIAKQQRRSVKDYDIHDECEYTIIDRNTRILIGSYHQGI